MAAKTVEKWRELIRKGDLDKVIAFVQSLSSFEQFELLRTGFEPPRIVESGLYRKGFPIGAVECGEYLREVVKREALEREASNQKLLELGRMIVRHESNPQFTINLNTTINIIDGEKDAD